MTDYWKNRFIKSTKDVFDSDEEYVKEIFKIYESTIEDLDSEIFKLLNSMEDVSMAEAKKLLNKYETRSFKSGLDEFRKASKGFISPDVEKELDIVSRRVRISRLQAMQVSMKSKVASLLNQEQKKLFAHLSNKFTSSYYKDLYELQRITGYKNINSLSKDFVNNILNTSWTNDGENFSDRIWKRKDKLLNTLDTELRQGLITGKRPDEITKVISDKLEVSKSNAKRLVLTESSAVHSQSRKAVYERLGVEKYEVVATLDLRTSDICRKLDGKVFDVKDYERGVTAPPFHVYCRSTTVPYYNDDIQAEIENTRMARDPETGKSLKVENLTYKEWYSKYIVEYNYKKEYENIVSILGYKAVGNLEKYRDIKYNDVERYNDIQKDYGVIDAINKNGKILDKERAKKLYYNFKAEGIYTSDHFIEHFIDREYKNNGEINHTFNEIVELCKEKPNYIDTRNEKQIISKSGVNIFVENGKYITLRKGRVSKHWKKI
ncbi:MULTISPECIES: minor capsid protein [Peptoniphilus]|uniref:minor capsid protein n=1 Tax=Peptoniphilus TaxID=162289 RepID=UPI0029142C65|nr:MULTISPECIES: minor capsid protein [Peptoniphilus]MDU5274407.1 minor capsid protein [Peptoniphilus lacydonensis]MDU5594422.1 minor capsid protein [Peptoniphilus rhinitidis]